ncbi:MAG: ABC transporter permease, partial [Gammaproteobacteria bacterium]|nr:ABC transporter permease [Gammaproteobacteria bacterium]
MSRASRIWGEILAQAWSALRDNRLRSVLSILGIAVGVAAVIAVGTIANSGRQRIFEELETFGLSSVWVYRRYNDSDPFRAERPGSGIQERDYQAIRQGCCDKVALATPYVEKEGPRLGMRAGNRYSNARISGVGVDYLAVNNDVIVRGRPFRLQDERRRRPVVILGPEVRDELFGPDRDPVGAEIRISGRKFTVIGLLQEKSRDFLAAIGSAGGANANNRVLVPYTVLQQMIGTKDIRLIQAQAVTAADADAAVTQIVTMLKRNHNAQYEYNSETMAQAVATANRILQGVSLIGIVAASVSLLVGGLGIMNIMTTSVLERTREIGVRKAI